MWSVTLNIWFRRAFVNSFIGVISMLYALLQINSTCFISKQTLLVSVEVHRVIQFKWIWMSEMEKRGNKWETLTSRPRRWDVGWDQVFVTCLSVVECIWIYWLQSSAYMYMYYLQTCLCNDQQYYITLAGMLSWRKTWLIWG